MVAVPLQALLVEFVVVLLADVKNGPKGVCRGELRRDFLPESLLDLVNLVLRL